jgi:predicted PurR-regulated permease PerM
MPQWVRWLWLTIAVLGAVWLGSRLFGVLLLVAIALLLTAALTPVVARLDERGLPHGGSVTLCILGLIGLMVGLMAYALPLLADQAKQLAASMGSLSDRFDWLQQHWGAWSEQFGLIPKFSEISAWARLHTSTTVERLIGLTGQFLTVMLGMFSVLFMTYFFLKDGAAMRDQVLGLIPEPQRTDTREVLARINNRVGRYVLGVILNMGVVGGLTTVGLLVLGVPYAAVLGLLIGVLDIVPVIGPFVGAFPGVLLAFGQSWQTGLWAMVVYWAVQQFEAYVTYPSVVGQAVQLHPAWIFLAFLFGGQLLGVPGMVLAIPTMVVVQIVLQEWYLPWVRKHRIRPTLVTPPAPGSVRYVGKRWETRPEGGKRPPGPGKVV